MLLARLSPIFPFALSNYFYGVTSIDFWPFIFGTLLGFAPGTLAYVYTGQLGKSLIIGDGTSGPWYIYVVGLALVAVTLKLITDFATKIISEIEADECSTVETSDSSE